MAHSNHDASVNEHGVVLDAKKGYCMLYFAMFLFCLIGAIIYVYMQNGNSIPDLTK
jgi:hypothetical protein